MAAHILCTGTNCQRTFINCPTRGNCEVACQGTESCIESVINCPLFGDCMINCGGQKSCIDITIDATLSSGNFKLLCDNGIDNCRRIKIYGSTLFFDHRYTFNVTCNGDERSCMNSEIHCGLNSDCYIGCHGFQSCPYANLIGPDYGSMGVGCNNLESCFDANINAAMASSLSIAGCTESRSCLDVAIYCPPNLNGVKQCHITGL